MRRRCSVTFLNTPGYYIIKFKLYTGNFQFHCPPVHHSLSLDHMQHHWLIGIINLTANCSIGHLLWNLFHNSTLHYIIQGAHAKSISFPVLVFKNRKELPELAEAGYKMVLLSVYERRMLQPHYIWPFMLHGNMFLLPCTQHKSV